MLVHDRIAQLLNFLYFEDVVSWVPSSEGTQLTKAFGFLMPLFVGNLGVHYYSSSSLSKDPEFLKAFFVGLMDGEGSIQVNHWRKKSLQYRMVIKLKNLPSNVSMLKKLADVVGGRVVTESGGKNVRWLAEDQALIRSMLVFFKKNPLLTAHKRSQLDFLTRCINFEGT